MQSDTSALGPCMLLMHWHLPADGRSSFRVNGLSLAVGEATAIASSVVSLVLEADACGTCSIATELFAESYQEIFVQATAVVEANLEGDSTFDMPAVAIANEFASQYVTATATAFAQVRRDPRHPHHHSLS